MAGGRSDATTGSHPGSGGAKRRQVPAFPLTRGMSRSDRGLRGQSPFTQTERKEPPEKAAFECSAGKLSYIQLFLKILKRRIYLAYRLLKHSLAVLFKK